MAGPLEGIRVVELGVWVAGPAAGGILADWGADVVKVEPIGGDPGRLFQFMLGGDMPTNPVFEMDNRGKRSIAMDLTTDDGRTVIEELLAQADVFVTNVRLGGLERLGLDHSSVTARHRRLVYAAVTGYGMEGTEADSGAFDVAGFWARSGIAHLLTPDGGDPPFQRGGMGDHSTALATAAGVCAALVARQRTGEGQLVSTSLLRQGAYTISFDLSITLGWGLTSEHRPPRHDGQPGHEQLHRRRRAPVLARGTRTGTALGAAGPSGGKARLDRRRALRHAPVPAPQRDRTGHRAR